MKEVLDDFMDRLDYLCPTPRVIDAENLIVINSTDGPSTWHIEQAISSGTSAMRELFISIIYRRSLQNNEDIYIHHFGNTLSYMDTNEQEKNGEGIIRDFGPTD